MAEETSTSESRSTCSSVFGEENSMTTATEYAAELSTVSSFRDLTDAHLEPVSMELSEASNSDLSSCESSDLQSDQEEGESSTESLTNKTVEHSFGPPLYVTPASDSLYKSRITVQQHLLSVTAFATKYNISTLEFQDLLSLLQLHLPENNLCESDINEIKRQCGFYSDAKTIHTYCSACGALRNNDAEFCETSGCCTKFDENANGSYFVTSSIENQIKAVLERDGNWGKIQDSHNRERSSAITDITDGAEYLKLREENGFLACPSNNITFTLFTDGIPLFKSSKVSLWPVYLIVNELPPNERFLKKNMLLWGLWQGTFKPKMNTYFKKLIVDLSHIYDRGITLSINGQSITCKAMLIVLTMDLQARAYLLNMT